jgi:hypothetical protein
MRAFLRKTISTLIIFIIGLLTFIFIVHIIVKYNSNFKIKADIKYIILGHSHSECAFNDDLITNFKNLSKSGEAYFYTYHKVKEVLSENKIDAVFIEFSNNQISKLLDEWIWEFETMNKHFPWHSPFMKKSDILFLYNKNNKDFLKTISTSTRHNLTRILSFDYSISDKYGSYKRLERNKVSELINKRKTNDDTLNENQNISTFNIKYLEKIINFCNKKKTKVYLIRSPQHGYYSRLNERTFLEIKNNTFKNVEFLDFDNFPLKDEEFGDFGHLNYKGARVFSLWFNELIKKNLLSKPNKGEYIQKEIEKVRAHNKCI